MQDGTVTTESLHDRVGLVGSLPTGLHPELGTGVHALQSCSIYSYSRILSHGHAPLDSSVLMFWDFYLSL
jgi:hypothetical protein